MKLAVKRLAVLDPRAPSAPAPGAPPSTVATRRRFPGATTAAANRGSNANARGTPYPAWSRPITATRSRSTSARASIASRTGRSDSLPVGPQHQTLAAQRRLTPRPVERHPVITPSRCRGPAGRPRHRGGDPAAVINHDQRARTGAAGEEVPGERRPLIRDRQPFGTEQSDRDGPSTRAGAATADPRRPSRRSRRSTPTPPRNTTRRADTSTPPPRIGPTPTPPRRPPSTLAPTRRHRRSPIERRWHPLPLDPLRPTGPRPGPQPTRARGGAQGVASRIGQ